MATGFAEAKRMNPLPKQDVQPISAFPAAPEQYEEAPRVIPFSEISARQLLGPQNPLEGPTSPDDIAGLVVSNRMILATLEKILVATRANHPSMPLAIREESGINNSLPISGSAKFKFFIDKRPAPALWLEVDNFSGQTIFVGLEDEASNQNIPIPTATSRVFNGITISWFSILNGATGGAIPVNGLSDTRGAPTQGANFIAVNAYGNPEYADIWGMTS